MSDTTIKRITGMGEVLKMLLVLGSIGIGLSAFLILPQKVSAIELRQQRLEQKQEEARDAIGELKGDVKSLLRYADRIERKIQ
jgi:hypothetical protein